MSEKISRFVGWLGVAAIGVLSVMPGDARVGYRKREHVAFIVLGLMTYAGVLELAQLWIPGRTSRLTDFVASASGVLAGMGVIEFMRIGLPLWQGTDQNRGCES